MIINEKELKKLAKAYNWNIGNKPPNKLYDYIINPPEKYINNYIIEKTYVNEIVPVEDLKENKYLKFETKSSDLSCHDYDNEVFVNLTIHLMSSEKVLNIKYGDELKAYNIWLKNKIKYDEDISHYNDWVKLFKKEKAENKIKKAQKEIEDLCK